MKRLVVVCFLILLIPNSAINSSAIGVTAGMKFFYSYTENTVNPLMEGESFVLIVNSVKNDSVYYTFQNSTTQVLNESKLSIFGQPFIYTDWTYWESPENILSNPDYKDFYTEPKVSQSESSFTVTLKNKTSITGLTYETKLTLSYDKQFGAIKTYSFSLLVFSDFVIRQDVVIYKLTEIKNTTNSSSPFPFSAIPLLILISLWKKTNSTPSPY